MGWDPCPWGLRGPEKAERFPHPKEPPHQQEDQLGRRISGAVRGEWNSWSVAGRTSLYALARDMCLQVHTGTGRDWVLEHGDWRANPGRGLLLDVRKQPEGTGMRKSTMRNVCGGYPDCSRRQAPLLTDVQGLDPPLQPLSPSTSPCPPPRG